MSSSNPSLAAAVNNDYHLIVLVEDTPPSLQDVPLPYVSNEAPTATANFTGTNNSSGGGERSVVGGGGSEHYLFLRGSDGILAGGGDGGIGGSSSSVNQAVEVFVLTVIALVGIVGNLLIAFTLIRRKQLKYPSNR